MLLSIQDVINNYKKNKYCNEIYHLTTSFVEYFVNFAEIHLNIITKKTGFFQSNLRHFFIFYKVFPLGGFLHIYYSIFYKNVNPPKFFNL